MLAAFRKVKPYRESLFNLARPVGRLGRVFFSWSRHAHFKRTRPRTFKTHTFKILQPKNSAERIAVNDRRRMESTTQWNESRTPLILLDGVKTGG